MRLNRWKEEEDKALLRIINNFHKKHNNFIDRIFLNPDKRNEMLERELNEERLKFRAYRLEFYEKKLEEERDRVDKVIDELEQKLNKYFEEVKGTIDREKLIDIKNEESKNTVNMRMLDEKIINIEPYRICLFQEKIFKDRK